MEHQVHQVNLDKMVFPELMETLVHLVQMDHR